MPAHLIRTATVRCLVGLLSLALLVTCGEAPSGPGSLQRLSWVPAPGSPAWPRAQVVERLAPTEADAGWTFEAADVLTEPGVDGRPGALRLATPPGGPAFGFGLRRELDPAVANELRLFVQAAGPGELSASFGRHGDVVASGGPWPLLVTAEPRALSVPLPAGIGGACESVWLSASPATRELTVVGAELVSRPPAARLPDPAGPPGLIDFGQGEARRGVGLSHAVPLVTRGTVPDGGQLSLSFAAPPEEGGGQVLTVAVHAGARRVSREWSVPSQDDEAGWQTAQLDLAELAGQEVEIQLSMRDEAQGRATALAVAEPLLWSAAAEPATLVLITSDTHRHDHLGASPGAVDVSTPVLDALAARGVSFDDCYAVTNVTNPSHAALLTGVHPRDLGVLRNNLPLNERAVTLAGELAAQGFVTRAVVSARHLGPDTSGLGAGFDRMAWPVAGERSAEATLELAMADLDEAQGRPLFLWVHLFDAHGPYDPPRAWRRQYWPDDRDPFDPDLPAPDLGGARLPPDLEGLRDLAWPAAAYRGEVSALDARLAELLARPRVGAGVLAFTADHGESLGQHGIWFGHAGLYPDSLHVPLVLSFPGAPAGRRVAAPVSHLDLGATLLDLLGVPRQALPGQSFADLARGAGPGRAAPRFALSAHGFSAAVRDGERLLLLQLRTQKQPNMERRLERHSLQLFDLAADPECLVDLSEQRLDVARALRARLVDWLSAVDDRGWSGELVQDPDLVAQLAQLGYLSSGEAARSGLWDDDDCAACRHFGAGR